MFERLHRQFLQGDKDTALEKPGTTILNESTAKRYFGSVENAMGKQIILNEFQKYIVSGVCRDWPDKSHFQFNVLLTTSGKDGLDRLDYIYFDPCTYLLLNKNASAATLEAKFLHIIKNMYRKRYKASLVNRIKSL